MGHDRTDDGGMLPVSFDGSVTVEVRNLPGRKTVAFCGTRGVPANYGGFETTVDEISRRFAENGYDAVVYCRKSSYAGKALKYHQGRRLVYAKGSSRCKLDTFVSAFPLRRATLRPSDQLPCRHDGQGEPSGVLCALRGNASVVAEIRRPADCT